jgi:hypothetical protein
MFKNRNSCIGCGSGEPGPITNDGSEPITKWEDDLEGFIQFTTNDPNYYNYMFYLMLNEPYQQEMTCFEAKVKKLSGFEHGSFGIIFCYQNDDNFYVLLITVRGWYCVYELQNGVWKEIIPWEWTEHLIDGYGIINSMRVAYSESANIFTIFLNNTITNTFEGNSLTGGYTGYIASVSGPDEESFPAAPVDVRFQNGLDSMLTWEGDYLIENNSDLIELSEYQIVDGTLTIRAPLLENLNGLENLTQVIGDLQIVHSDVMINVDGLNNINFVGGKLWIYDNDQLLNIDSLKNLKYVGGDISINWNYYLDNLDGLNGLTTVNGDMYIGHSGFTVIPNSGITDINGLNNITTIHGSLVIDSVPNLTNLDGLNNLSLIDSDLQLRHNFALQNINGLSNLTTIPGSLIIDYSPDLENIDGLSDMTSIGNLTLSTLGSLMNINALSNITSIHNLHINSTNLSSLEGLHNLASVEWELGIGDNWNLLSLDGLRNLSFIGEDLNIQRNVSLTNLDGLNNLHGSKFGGYLRIFRNDSLPNSTAIDFKDRLVDEGWIGGWDIRENGPG